MADDRLKRVAVNEAARILRDQADRDYICARHLYELGFADQFMWQAQQALEKYMKATLLFGSKLQHEGGRGMRRLSGKKGYGHKLNELLADFKKIETWTPELPESVCRCVAHVQKMGLNRYSERHVYRIGDEMPRLDEAVWHIRRWCRYCPRVPPRNAPPSFTPERWVQVERDFTLRMSRGPRQHIGGLLESVIASQRSGMWWRARTALLKCNQWFYAKRRSGILPPRWSSWSEPVWDRTWTKDPEIANLFDVLGVGPSPSSTA